MRGTLRSLLPVAAAVLPLLLAATAHASRIGRIDTEAAEVYKEPQNGSEVADRVTKGTLVEVSNQQVQGYYKVRLRSGKIGWMHTDTVTIDPTLSSVEPVEQASGPSQPLSTLPYLGEAPAKNRRGALGLRGFGGLDFLQANEVSGRLGLDDFHNGFYFGGQLHYFFSRDFSAVFRVESVFKTVVATDRTTHKTYQHDLSSLPVMGGFEIEFVHTKRLYFDFLVAAGLALSTNLTTTSLSDAEPNKTTFTDTPFTGVGALEANVPLSKDHASLYFEGGYRILKTTDLSPSTTGNGSDVYNNNGSFQTFPLDLSGFFLGAGFVVYL